MAFDLLLDPLVKKLTVKGIMGNTQGVNRAINPPTIPNKKMPQRDFSDFFSPQSPIGLSKSTVWILYLLLRLTECRSVFNDA